MILILCSQNNKNFGCDFAISSNFPQTKKTLSALALFLLSEEKNGIAVLHRAPRPRKKMHFYKN